MLETTTRTDSPEAGRVTSEDLELIHSLSRALTTAPPGGEKPQLLREINRMILDYDERKLRFVYFFAKGLS